MKQIKRTLAVLCSIACLGCTYQSQPAKTFNLATYHPHADGATDDTPAFRKLFDDVMAAGGGTVTIPPGVYFMQGEKAISIPSNTTVSAIGAEFRLPVELGDRARIVLFEGNDVTHFSWFGGFFKGYCFDPAKAENTWEPNVTTRMLVFTSSPTGTTDQLHFRDIRSDGVAGSVINVMGYTAYEDEETAANSEVNFATNITVENCTLLRTGKFMWDYGYLWQFLVFPEESTPAEVTMAKKYFHNELVRENLKLDDGSDKVCFDNATNPPRLGETVCFYDDRLPQNIVRGRQYFVVESTPEYIRISETKEGKPLAFTGAAGPDVKLMFNLNVSFMDWGPIGTGPGKGCIDLVRCRNTKILGCTISALGDAMHVYGCHNNIIANNQILGARMGAFFLAEYSKNSTVTGNTVDGANGSRVVSIERSNEDVTMVGNVFRNGGRGCWINQPRNLIIKGNIFVNNTNKGTRDHHVGRRDFKTGGWQSYPEIYFSTYQEGATYGPVIIADNIFVTSPEAAAVIHFAENGRNIQVTGNSFTGATDLIMIDEDNPTITVANNQGGTVNKGKNPAVKFAN